MTIALFDAKLTFWKLVVWERVKYTFMDAETLGKKTLILVCITNMNIMPPP